MFSCEFWKHFKNTFFYRTSLVAASVPANKQEIFRMVFLDNSCWKLWLTLFPFNYVFCQSVIALGSKMTTPPLQFRSDEYKFRFCKILFSINDLMVCHKFTTCCCASHQNYFLIFLINELLLFLRLLYAERFSLEGHFESLIHPNNSN